MVLLPVITPASTACIVFSVRRASLQNLPVFCHFGGVVRACFRADDMRAFFHHPM
jgi:hypothetical protein